MSQNPFRSQPALDVHNNVEKRGGSVGGRGQRDAKRAGFGGGRGSFGGRGGFSRGRRGSYGGRGGSFGGRGSSSGGRKIGGGFHEHSKRDEIGSGYPKNIEQKSNDWGKVKFNPVAAIASESATPWKKFKDEIIQKNENEEKVDKNSEEEKAFQKKRAENFRKMQILEKQKQPTQWEDFGVSKVKATKTKNSKREESEEKNAFREGIIQSFKNKSMTTDQNNYMRQIITTGACMINKKNSLKDAVKDLKRLKEIEMIKLKSIRKE